MLKTANDAEYKFEGKKRRPSKKDGAGKVANTDAEYCMAPEMLQGDIVKGRNRVDPKPRSCHENQKRPIGTTSWPVIQSYRRRPQTRPHCPARRIAHAHPREAETAVAAAGTGSADQLWDGGGASAAEAIVEAAAIPCRCGSLGCWQDRWRCWSA